MTDGTAERAGVQLDRSDRATVERAVLSMRQKAESDLRYQLEQRFGLEDPETVPSGLSEEERAQRERLREAIEREAVDGHGWSKALELYVQGAGYTVVNRLAALRCLEVRGFLARAVTRLRSDGRTPASDPLIDEEFYTPEEAVLEAYGRACDELAEEVELLFDRESVYSRLEPRRSAFEELCRTLDEVPDEVWRADDVLGWVYQYYHLEDLDELRKKAHKQGLDPEDVAPANQFYTPHWVVRMLTDNSLGKLYLEHAGALQEAVETQEPLSPEERKTRSLAPEASPTVADVCTYLVPGSEAGTSPEWSDPEELKVIDPACGSGHFLLYAFDVLERIWWAERPDILRSEVPARILRHNLYGVDIDLRACQLAAFNLYLKARGRAEAEGAETFELPPLNIVCADARVAELAEAEEVIDEVAPEGSREQQALEGILETFRGSYGLGSLLDVKGTLREELLDEQRDAFAAGEGPEELLHALLEAVENRRTNGSFLVRDLRSFLRLLEVLAGSYDVALMNPPYGAQRWIPSIVKTYMEGHYTYSPSYHISFLEQSGRLVKQNGRIAMLVPRAWMFKKSQEAFRKDFVGRRATFDFLAEYGLGVLDHATVRTVGAVVRNTKATEDSPPILFVRLHDVEANKKERVLNELLAHPAARANGTTRLYRRRPSDFERVPGAPLSYWVGPEIRALFSEPVVMDAENAGLDRKSAALAKTGVCTGNNKRFYHYYWERPPQYDRWVPVAKGGADAFLLPHIARTVYWEKGGAEIKRIEGSRHQNAQHFFREGLTWTFVKEGGKRFGYLYRKSIFGHAGKVLLPEGDTDIWVLLAYVNTSLFTYLVLSLTLYRGWQVGKIAPIPWPTLLQRDGQLRQVAKQLVALRISERSQEPTSPHYCGPKLLLMMGFREGLHAEGHPHRAIGSDIEVHEIAQDATRDMSLGRVLQLADDWERKIESAIETRGSRIEEIVFEKLGFRDELIDEIGQEIRLRSGSSFESDDGGRLDGECESEAGDSLESSVRELMQHFVSKVVRTDADGVVPFLSLSEAEEPDLLSRVVGEFERIWGEHAEDRLREADEVLGDRAPSGGQPYPNLRSWLNEELFDYHTSTFENTPFLWRLTTERLVPEAKGEGFGCVIDYHQLSQSTFDTLRQRYLEPRRAALRERREAADDRQRDPSLPAGERQQAQETFERCQSGLEQIEALEVTLRELARPRPRDWSEEDRRLAEELAPQVVRFRERLETRLQTLDELFETATDAWLEDVFSPTFRQSVEEHRGEWVDALEDLETACGAYARPAEEPVEAHLYDLFVYLEKLAGSTHYSSNGIFFLNYYFSKGKKYLTDEGSPRPGLRDEERLLAELAAETDRDIELGEQVKASCKELARRIPSDWEERALNEVRNAGYRAVKKHGVRINITPLAEARLVPETVDDRVL